jgi:hypothetical protein
MKNTFLVLSLIICCINGGYSQVQKGNLQLGGNASFSSNRSYDLKNNTSYASFTINPYILKSITDNFALGLKGSFYNSSGNGVHYGYSFGTMARYYGQILPNLYLFSQADAALWKGVSKYPTGSEKSTSNYFASNIGAGALYLLNNRLGIEMNMSFIQYSYSNSLNNHHNMFREGHSFTISPFSGLEIGLQYNFIKK